jgi:hypothetical protein
VITCAAKLRHIAHFLRVLAATSRAYAVGASKKKKKKKKKGKRKNI